MRALALVSSLIASAGLAQEASAPPKTQPAGPLLQAIDPAVEKWWSENREPCRKPIKLGVPCFPIEIHAEGPIVSVRDSLWDLAPNGRPSEHRPPTAQEMQSVRPAPRSMVAPLMSFDPVCAAKHALKAVEGKNDTYYLYRLRDTSGEHVVLRDRKLDAKAYQGSAEFLGQFDGECAAIAAFRHEDRRDTIKP
jgi:hypothetical protein